MNNKTEIIVFAKQILWWVGGRMTKRNNTNLFIYNFYWFQHLLLTSKYNQLKKKKHLILEWFILLNLIYERHWISRRWTSSIHDQISDAMNRFEESNFGNIDFGNKWEKEIILYNSGYIIIIVVN